MRKSKNGNSVTMLLMLKIRNKEKKLFHTPCITEFFLHLGLNQRKPEDPLRRRRGRRRSRQ